MNPKTGKYEQTYLTFEQVEKGVYRYCGHCFAGRESILHNEEVMA